MISAYTNRCPAYGHFRSHVLCPRAFLQVEYLPCWRVADGLEMIEAFLPSLDEDGTLVATTDIRDPVVFGTDPQYSVKHTALQTTDLFNKIFA